MNERAAQYYEYEPLGGPREIRLLKVSRVGKPKRFLCELIPVAMDDLPTAYLAISYTWGSPTPYSTVSVGGNKVLNITKSVFAILDTLFYPGETMHIWIDSLCINQEDSGEKSHQVRLMDEIYAKSQQVVICLGEATVESDRGLDFIYPLRNAIRAARLAHEDQSLATVESILQKGGFDFTSPSWIALGDIFRRPWFQRMWVVQEVVMGPHPLFVCGERAIGWDLMVYVATRLIQHALEGAFEYNLKEPSRLLAAPEGIPALAAMNEARALKQEGESENFQDTLIGMYSFKCSDPRDKIFALLGISTDAQDVMLDPDYDASVEEVYTRTARYLLQRDKSIVILHHAGVGNPRRYQNLPSWVPQWDSGLEDDRLSLGGMHKWSKYNAAKDSLPKVRAVGAEVLVVQGVIVDVVSEIASVWRVGVFDGSVDSLRAKDLVILEENEKLIDGLRSRSGASSESYTGNDQSWEEAFWRSLIANSALTKPAPADYGAYFTMWRHRLLNPTADGALSPAQAEEKRQSTIFNQAMTMATKNRRFLVTEKGYIGLTSPRTFPGDRVCIFLGGVTPFIIRENIFPPSTGIRERTWTLVGEAYVHGLMDGEGLDIDRTQEIHLM